MEELREEETLELEKNASADRIKQLERTDHRLKQLERTNHRMSFVIGALLGILAFFVIDHISHKKQALPVDASDIYTRELNLDGNPDIKQMVEENHLRYLNKAYILIGNYPDCEYIKISANVSRNDYSWSQDFYVGEGELYYNYYKDGKAQGKVGIDVSEFQNTIDWEKVKAAGIDIAMIRIGYRGYGTEGRIKKDSKAESNLEGASAAGIDTGVYFYSSAINKVEGIEEAEFVLEQLNGRSIKEPVVIDTEYEFTYEEARANNIPIEDRTAAVVGFCETIEAAGYTPMVYASRDQFIKYLNIDDIGKWEFWLAAYDTPVFPYHTEGYQYTPYGYVDGIDTQVDLDVWMR